MAKLVTKALSNVTHRPGVATISRRHLHEESE